MCSHGVAVSRTLPLSTLYLINSTWSDNWNFRELSSFNSFCRILWAHDCESLRRVVRSLYSGTCSTLHSLKNLLRLLGRSASFFLHGLGIGLSKAIFFTLGLGVGRCKGIPLGLGVGLEILWKPQRQFALALNVHSNPFHFVAEHFIAIIMHKKFSLIGVLAK